MHEDSSVVSWITDYKDRPHFVCVESSVSYRQESSAALPQESVTYSTSQKSECVDTVCSILERERERER